MQFSQQEYTQLARVGADDAEVVDDGVGEFFPPVSADVIDGLVASYQAHRRKIEEIARIVQADDCQAALGYFIEGNYDSDRRSGAPTPQQLFALPGAIGKLNAHFWQQMLRLTDVLECMPQARRDQWHEQIANPLGLKNRTYSGEPETWKCEPLPDFEEVTVRATLDSLLAARSKFFAERVDGVFRALSGEHVTNRPEGFGKRMILAYVLDSFGGVNYQRSGLIGDLRSVVAKFMGRDDPRHLSTQPLLAAMRRATGEWHALDGGALRIRVYKKGTAHIEVHPDMAWRLNAVLAQLYPQAIPAPHRQRPRKAPKAFALLQRPLPFEVLEVLGETGVGHRPGRVYHLAYGAPTKGRAYVEACEVLELLGGVRTSATDFTFDYVPDSVIEQVLLSGCIPDQRAHQFYPTPDSLAAEAAQWAEIGDHDKVLEPSAGRGNLAKHLPADRTTCVEIAALQCDILRAQGLQVVQADFLEYALDAQRRGMRFQRIVMNPPFSDGRAQLHLEHAATLLAAGGAVVAILPASFRGKELLPGCSHEWSRVYNNEFAGTSVAVAMLKARRI